MIEYRRKSVPYHYITMAPTIVLTRPIEEAAGTVSRSGRLACQVVNVEEAHNAIEKGRK